MGSVPQGALERAQRRRAAEERAGIPVSVYDEAKRLREALEEIDASLIPQPDGTFQGYGSLLDTLRFIKAQAAEALSTQHPSDGSSEGSS